MTTVFERIINTIFKPSPQVRCAHIVRDLHPLYRNVHFDYMPTDQLRGNPEIITTFRPNFKIMMSADNTPFTKEVKNIDHDDQIVYLCCFERNEQDTVYYLAYEECKPQYPSCSDKANFIVYDYKYQLVGINLDDAILHFMEEPESF